MLPQSSGRGSTSEAPESSGSKRQKLNARQIVPVNDSLYKFDSALKTPTMQVLFFHGLQFDDPGETHLRTWEDKDKSCIWPQKWLIEDFPGAQIFYVSYDGVVKKGCQSNGSVDMKIIGENLVSDLMQAKIGQMPNCPVIMVGHCFGGTVIKQLCLQAHQTFYLQPHHKLTDQTELKTFLDNVKGIFYYSTPHYGSDIFEKGGDIKHPLWPYFRVLSKEGARLNDDFNKLCDLYKWEIRALGASLSVQAGQFEGLEVVKEASARVGRFTQRAADHFGICKPKDKTSSGYYELKQLVESIASSIPLATEAVVPIHLCHGLPNFPTGLQRRATDVQDKIKNAPAIGIVGMGGIGKTTLAKQVFNNISMCFEFTCFADNVKDIPKHELEDWLLRHFYCSGKKVDGNKIQWSDLKEKNVLIVLDDVNSEKQTRILPSLDHFNISSRLIFTTRDQSVLDTVPKCVIYDVDFLDFDEAKKLFSQHAFDQEGIPDSLMEKNHHLEENVNKVVKKCDGLPLTLEVMGSYLRAHKTDARAWEETLDKLGKVHPVNGVRNDRLWCALRLSYDALSPEEQVMFIEAGIYFFGQPVERALAAWSTSCNFSQTGWTNLLRTSMVKEIYNQTYSVSWNMEVVKYKEVWVHEQLRDLAKDLSNGAMVSRSVGDRYPAEDPSTASEVEPQTSILRLSFHGYLKPQKLQLELLDKLKYLELENAVVEGSSTSLSRKLSLLKWSRTRMFPQWVPEPLLPISLEGMNNLGVLELHNCGVPEQSFEALGTLTNLRILSLSDIQGPAHLPEDFGYLSKLELLKFRRVRLTALPHSFGNLSGLKHLVLENLEVVELPESFGNLSSLTQLSVAHCDKLESLPQSFGHLSSLDKLILTLCPRLQRVPNNFGQLKALRELTIEDAPDLQALPESFGLLSALQNLKLQGCRQLQRLPDNFGQLKALRELRIWICPLEALPESFGLLSALQNLQLGICRQLQRLPDNFGQLKALRELRIANAPDLKALPESFGLLSALQNLQLGICRQLQRLLDNFGQLKALRELTIWHCPLEALPESFGLLSALGNLSLQDCRQLQRLPDNFGQLKALRELMIWNCPLEALPESFGLLSALQNLGLQGCTQLQRLPDNFGQLKALRELEIWNCPLEALPESFGLLSALQNLRLGMCRQLQRLLDNFGQLKALRELMIWKCPLEALPESFGLLSALQDLSLHDCRQLQRLPDNFGQLSALKLLCISGANQLEALPDNLGNLSSLRKLVIWAHSRLQSLPASIGHLQSLRRLEIRAPGLESLPDELGNLLSLEFLNANRCQKIRTVPDSLGGISSLRKVILRRCSGLTSLPCSLGQSLSRRLVEAQSAERASTQGLPALYVLGCPLLDKSALRSLAGVKLAYDLDACDSDWDVFGNLHSSSDELDHEQSDLGDNKSRPGEVGLQDADSHPGESGLEAEASSESDGDGYDSYFFFELQGIFIAEVNRETIKPNRGGRTGPKPVKSATKQDASCEVRQHRPEPNPPKATRPGAKSPKETKAQRSN